MTLNKRQNILNVEVIINGLDELTLITELVSDAVCKRCVCLAVRQELDFYTRLRLEQQKNFN